MSDTQSIDLNSAALGIGRHVSGMADPVNGHIEAFRIAHVQRSDGWIATTWHNLSDPGAFAAAWAGEREGGDPPPLAGAGVVVSASWGEGGPQSREMIGFSRSRSRGHGGVILAAMGGLKLFGMRAAYDEIVAMAIERQHEPPRIIGDLLTAEISEKQARSMKYQLTIAKLPFANFSYFQGNLMDTIGYSHEVADGVGFEPTRGVNPCRFSRPVLSTAQPPIRMWIINHLDSTPR